MHFLLSVYVKNNNLNINVRATNTSKYAFCRQINDSVMTIYNFNLLITNIIYLYMI